MRVFCNDFCSVWSTAALLQVFENCLGDRDCARDRDRDRQTQTQGGCIEQFYGRFGFAGFSWTWRVFFMRPTMIHMYVSSYHSTVYIGYDVLTVCMYVVLLWYACSACMCHGATVYVYFFITVYVCAHDLCVLCVLCVVMYDLYILRYICFYVCMYHPYVCNAAMYV
jgi:hypothetical protein